MIIVVIIVIIAKNIITNLEKLISLKKKRSAKTTIKFNTIPERIEKNSSTKESPLLG